MMLADPGPMTPEGDRRTDEIGRIRLDKWLWHARFAKTRSLAAQLCAVGIRICGRPTHKPHHPVKPGDVLTFRLGNHIRVIRILHVGERRGPADEARGLYEDLAPPTAENRLPG